MSKCPNHVDRLHRYTCECGDQIQSENYNGWSNRETWAVALHLGNTETLDAMARGAYGVGILKAREAAKELAEYGVTFNNRLVTNHAADTLKEMVTDWFADVFDGSVTISSDIRLMASDVGSLWRVEWSEVAEAFAPELVES